MCLRRRGITGLWGGGSRSQTWHCGNIRDGNFSVGMEVGTTEDGHWSWSWAKEDMGPSDHGV